jgi:hypothetical protein
MQTIEAEIGTKTDDAQISGSTEDAIHGFDLHYRNDIRRGGISRKRAEPLFGSAAADAVPTQAGRAFGDANIISKGDVGTEVHRPTSRVMNDPLRIPGLSTKRTGKGPNRRYFRCLQAKIVYDFGFQQGILDPFKGRTKNA